MTLVWLLSPSLPSNRASCMYNLSFSSLIDNIKKVQHLLDLPKSKTHLTLWKADLSVEGSFDEAIQGCTGVFHVATPMDFESKDPEV